uniref:Tyrosine-protein phosphatase domain-containing protein n=1 Tax=Parastrongyloides trichosuri TaxID=131310 RepID=A0A0N5A094_PARTI
DKMEWVCIYKTPNGKVTTRNQFARNDLFAIVKGPNGGRTFAPVTGNVPLHKPSFFDRMKKQLGAPLFYGLLVIVVLVVLIALLFVLFLVFRSRIRYYFLVAEKRKNYPNIITFWNDVNTQTINKYSKIVTEESYIPSKVRDIKLIKHVSSDDGAVDYVTNLFDDTLIGCFKEIGRQIKAYYIQDVSPKRKYIISEGPRKETTMNFFKMLYLEDVRVVVAIIYRDNNDLKKTKKNICYWPDKAVMFGSLSIEPIDLPNTKCTSNLEFSFRMKIGNASWKNLTIIHVPDWREFELPSTTLNQRLCRQSICYWPNKAVMFGPLIVEPIDLPDTKSASNLEFSFRMKLGNGSWKNLTIIHVPDWREFELPSTTLSLIELYKRINDCAGSRNVLIHSSQAFGTRVFLVTYFACIFEAMIKDKSLSNPMDILKMVREKCLGGQVTPREFGFMICSVLKHFINCAYLVDKESVQLKFANNIDNFIYHTRIVEADESNTFAQMMKFFAATNRGKMLDIIKQSQTVQMFDLDTLKAKCTRHLAVLKNRGMNKIRYPGVFCLDDAAVCIWGRPKNDLNSFIHANEMSYEIRNGKRRKLIMCQAPIPDTFDDMLDMIYRYKVGIIVLLVNPQERNGHTPKWSPYFPI